MERGNKKRAREEEEEEKKETNQEKKPEFDEFVYDKKEKGYEFFDEIGVFDFPWLKDGVKFFKYVTPHIPLVISMGSHISPHWYDIVHFGPRPSWICFWTYPKGLIPMEIYFHTYKLMILPIFIRCGTLVAYPTGDENFELEDAFAPSCSYLDEFPTSSTPDFDQFCVQNLSDQKFVDENKFDDDLWRFKVDDLDPVDCIWSTVIDQPLDFGLNKF